MNDTSVLTWKISVRDVVMGGTGLVAGVALTLSVASGVSGESGHASPGENRVSCEQYPLEEECATR